MTQGINSKLRLNPIQPGTPRFLLYGKKKWPKLKKSIAISPVICDTVTMLNAQQNNTAAVEVQDFDALVKLLDGNKSARFISLLYRSKESGELARHTLLLNVNRRNALARDLAVLSAKLPKLSGVARQACEELIASITETLTTGQNSQYTKAGYYQGQGNGNVQVSVKAVCYIRGYSIRKEVIEPGTYKEVRSSAKTIEKNKLRKQLKNTRCREFIIRHENFILARAEGKAIVIDASARLNELAKLPPVTVAVPVTA